MRLTVAYTCHTSSLVPRPFPPQLFDCLQYAKTEREGLGDLVMSMKPGRQRVDVRGEG